MPAIFFNGRDLDRLINHDWPGNVRELENTIQRYVNLNVLEFPGEEEEESCKTGSHAITKRPFRGCCLTLAA